MNQIYYFCYGVGARMSVLCNYNKGYLLSEYAPIPAIQIHTCMASSLHALIGGSLGLHELHILANVYI